ncbi:MAG: hypothetical protein V3U84_09055 [Thiotrichaceae bacterium]
MVKFIYCCSFIFFSFSFSANAKKSEPLFCSNQIVAHKTQNGYTWTLASRLGELMGYAEKEYGERNKTWTILGTEFTDREQPRNWNPFYYQGKKNIIIQLSKKAAHDEKEAMFQLAHETFHALVAPGKNDATFFEEGLATYFSIQATRRTGVKIKPSYIASSKYRKAFDLVKAVYKAHPDAGKRITSFRKKGIHPSSLNEKHLKIVFPNIEASVARQLAERF